MSNLILGKFVLVNLNYSTLPYRNQRTIPPRDTEIL